MLSRRQFLKLGFGAMGTVAGLSFLWEYEGLNQSIPVLLYHRIGQEDNPYTITAEHFESNVKALSQEGYTTVSLNQVQQIIQHKSVVLPEKPLIITFDDGYLDNYLYAFPLLQKYSMVASFYIITGIIGQADRLTIPQIREMQAAGMDFGSHTVTHRLLGTLSVDEVKTELAQSKVTLEQIVGGKVNFVAYPGGSYSSDTLQIAQEAGYMAGWSTRLGVETFKHPFTLKRIPIFHHDQTHSISYILLKKGFIPGLLFNL